MVNEETFFGQIIEAARLGTWDWNVVTDELSVNSIWMSMMGYSSEDFRPHVNSWSSIVHPEDLPRVLEQLQRFMDGQTRAYQAEYRIIRKTGETIWCFDSGQIVCRTAEGKPERLIGIQQEITELKLSQEEISRKKYTLEQIAWKQSHRVRGPLTRIKGLMNIIQMEQDRTGKAMESYFQLLTNSVNELDEVVKEIIIQSIEEHDNSVTG